MGKLIGVVGLVGIFAVILLVGMMYVSYSNTEIGLRNTITAKQKANEAVFDKTWKTIKQITQCKDDYRDSFKEVMIGMAEKRYSKDQGGTLARWIQESNIAPDPTIFTKVMNAIESNRGEFLNTQVALLDLNREHTDVITKFPGSVFVGSRGVIDVVIVTSSKTQEAFATGKEEIE